MRSTSREAVVDEAARRHPEINAECCDVRELPYEDGTFDAVVSTSTLDHFETIAEIGEALRELRRVLAPGGTLVVSLDNLSNPLVAVRNALPFRWLHRIGLVPHYVGATCRPGELQRLLASTGFDVQATTAIMHVPRVIALAVGGGMDTMLGFERLGQLADAVSHGAVRGSARGEARMIRRLWFGGLAWARVYRRLELVVLSLDPPPALRETPLELEYGFLAETDDDDVRARLDRGDRCFVAREAGTVVSSRWIAGGRAFVEYLGMWLDLEPDEVFLSETFTVPGSEGPRGVRRGGHAARARARGGRLSPYPRRRARWRTTPASGRTRRRATCASAGSGYIGVGPWRREFRR